jgi:tetratricopeptide (TPR) repeat protein
MTPMWVWGCMGLATLGCAGMCVLTLVLTPIAFRLLPVDVQARVAGRVPFFEAFLPTRDPSLEALPTVDPARAATAAALAPGGLPSGGVGGGQPTAVLGYAPPGATYTPTPFLTGPTLPAQATQGVAFRPTATAEPLPATFHVGNVSRVPQTWNNCGPANLVQALQLLGKNTSQADVAAWLKPNRLDANVSPWQIAAYTNQFTEYRAVVRANGNLQLLKRLAFAGFGVLIETGLYSPDDGQWEGHYLTVVGWNDPGGYMYGLDTLIDEGDPRGIYENYADLDERWKHFNRVYIVLYEPRYENRVRDLLGTAWDATTNAEEALDMALAEAQRNPNDVFAWFNAGTNFVALGQWGQAAAHYDRARTTGSGLPWRMLWYQFGPFTAYYNVGDYQTVLDLANAVIRRIRYIEETFYYRGLASAALGLRDQATNDLRYAAGFNPNFAPAQTALVQLQSGINPVPEVL